MSISQQISNYIYLEPLHCVSGIHKCRKYILFLGGGVSIITACAWLVCILVPLIIGETPNYALSIMVDLCWQVKYWGAVVEGEDRYMHLCVASIFCWFPITAMHELTDRGGKCAWC